MSACFHCGLPAPAGATYCCPGCEAVARTILAAGCGAYYETRSAPGAPPQQLPALPDYRDFSGDEASLVLQGVRCAACLWLIERTLRAVPGVARASVNYATQRAQVAWDREKTGLKALIEAVRAVGYDAAPYEPALADAAERRERRTALWRLFVAGFAAMQVMMYAFPAYIEPGGLSPAASELMRWASLLLTVPVLAFSCTPFFAGAREELRRGRLGLDTPIALGLAGGFLASAWATVSGGGEVYFDSVSMLAFLLLGARFLESSARRRAARVLDPLLRWMPARRAAAGETLQVAPGERVPADGVVLSGASSADESLLTGESRAVPKRPGDELIAGSVNLEQPLVMRATRVGAETRAAGIARLVERGAASKPRLVRDADRVAGVLTAVILFVSLVAFINRDAWAAIAVLVVACPCALALAAPVVLTRASGEFLERGMLLADAAALQALARATDVILDKTGTLTTGCLAVSGVWILGKTDETRCLALAAALESGSRHPISRAFPGGKAVEGARHALGRGIEGRIDGRLVRIGNLEFCRALCLQPAPTVEARVYLADERGWLAAFELEDELRPDALPVISELKARYRVHLASGDSAAATREAGDRLGILEAQGAMAPEDKFALLERLQREGRTVVMVGDGLNDAPVLARADASFALAGGADAAKLHADVVLLASLSGIPAAAETARRSMRLIRQNLGWALAYNAIALPLAATGLIGPWEAALAMGASSVSVLLNALRPLAAPQTSWKASTSSFPSRSPSYS